MGSFLLPQLGELQALRGNPTIVYHSLINHAAIRPLYECLRHIGPTQRLDVVLSTSGGTITTARRLALLLREFTPYLTILVPDEALSAGTLLCLSANELVLGPLSELSPIDAHIGSAGSLPPDAPGVISAEEIRVFRQMAEDWFGVNREKERLHVLALLAQRVFPTSLSSFYRADRLTRQVARELLRYQLPESEESIRQQIVNQLISGYDAHDHIITRVDAQKLGLRVHVTSPEEEAVLWDLSKMEQRQFLGPPGLSDEDGIVGLIMSTHFCARQFHRWVNIPGSARMGARQEEDGSDPQKMLQSFWEIDGE